MAPSHVLALALAVLLLAPPLVVGAGQNREPFVDRAGDTMTGDLVLGAHALVLGGARLASADGARLSFAGDALAPQAALDAEAAAREAADEDLSTTLLDGFAHVGDQLSFYQERIANEAHLRTSEDARLEHTLREFVEVRMQQGRVELDEDWNEALEPRDAVDAELRAALAEQAALIAALAARLAELEARVAALEDDDDPE